LIRTEGTKRSVAVIAQQEFFILIFLVFLLLCYETEYGFSKSTNEKKNENQPSLVKVYKEVGIEKLNLYIFLPNNFKKTDHRPAGVFYHGGGWFQGSVEWGYSYCSYYASLGMVAFSVEYRLSNQKDITPAENIADAKSAVRWIREHASELGVDTGKIVVSGQSAGGHLAASVGTLDGYDEKCENLKIRSRPNAMLLYSAPVDPTVDRWFLSLLLKKNIPEELSPSHHVRSGLPPALVLHGTVDQIVPVETVKKFTQKMIDSNNVCEMHLFENADHSVCNSVTPAVRDLIKQFLIKISMIEK
jgi:acetyl esterase